MAFCDVTFPKIFGTNLDDVLKHKMIKAQSHNHDKGIIYD
jgi:hypothetical protein